MENYIPLTLYIHIPYCEKKCPYCDFNSHTAKGDLPEKTYIHALIEDLKYQYQKYAMHRTIQAIFIGGGTPSLFSGSSIKYLLALILENYPTQPNLEITIECNPNSLNEEKIKDFEEAKINRISIGVQSFDDDSLNLLGRIHNGNTAINAIQLTKQSNIKQINVDLMYGIPKQKKFNTDQSLKDVQTAIKLGATHLSIYEFTIEPNTYFAKYPPLLPKEKHIHQIIKKTQQYLKNLPFPQYEISAYAQRACQHNLNYWKFGDYLGIGAGAHGKFSNTNLKTIIRTTNKNHPQQYLQTSVEKKAIYKTVDEKNRVFEFMLNALRLKNGFHPQFLKQRAFVPLESIQKKIDHAIKKKLLSQEEKRICTTSLGWQFLNETQMLFLPE